MLITHLTIPNLHSIGENSNMVDITTGNKVDKWVCPSDRHLALRAKLSTGWSVKTQDLKEYGRKNQSLNEMEQNVIKKVIQRAEILEQREQERVGRLVDRLDNMKRNIMGNGTTQCILCGDTFRLFGTSNFLCCGCKKLVCEKCGIEILTSNQESLWLCKICSETREMWKKTGAWFFKGLPKYKLPENKTEKLNGRKSIRPGLEKNNWSKSNINLSADTINKTSLPKESETYTRTQKESSFGQVLRELEEFGKNAQSTSSNPNCNEGDKSSKCFARLCNTTGSSSNSTNNDEEAENESKQENHGLFSKEKYNPGVGAESSEYSSSSPISVQSSMFSGSQQSFTLQPSAYSITKPTSITSDGSPFNFEEGKGTLPYLENLDKKFVSMNKSYHAEMELQKYRKKGSIDFGKATSLLKYPLKKKEKNKLNKFSSSESQLESSSGNGKFTQETDTGDEFLSESDKSSTHTECQYALGASHWMSQDSSIHIYDSLSDLNVQPKWSRRESMTSLSRDYWSEDQLSMSSSLGTNNEEISEVIGGKNAQLGILELSLWYDPVRSALHCTLHRGKGLRSTDINGLADPFCKLTVLPMNGKSTVVKTKTVHKTINPEFNESVNFYGITEKDIQRKTLHILVLDDDKYGNDFLGEARIPLFKIGAKQTKHVSVFLDKLYQIGAESEIWEEDRWNRGKILVTLSYSTKKRALIVFIGRCMNLLPMDNNGLSDPFVKLHLTSDPNHKKYKTSVKWKNLNPVFNEEFVFETKITDLLKQTLILSIWDKDYGKSNDYLGGLELGCKSKGERLKHWIDVFKFPDHKHESWHRLGNVVIVD